MLALAIAGIVLALIAIVVSLGIEILKRPRLRIDAAPWSPQGPVPWTFAVVRVQNLPLGRPWSWLLQRNFAPGCELIAEFRQKGLDPLLLAIPCRWSIARPPTQQVLQETAYASTLTPPTTGGAALPELAAVSPQPFTEMRGTALPPSQAASASYPSANVSPSYAAIFDPEAARQSYQLDIAPREEGYEAAVAILVSGKGAFAFNAESYRSAYFGNPEWHLTHGDYEVTVIARSGQITQKRVFSLTYLDDDFSKFKLQPRA